MYSVAECCSFGVLGGQVVAGGRFWWECIYVFACGGQQSTPVILPQEPSPCFLRESLTDTWI